MAILYDDDYAFHPIYVTPRSPGKSVLPSPDELALLKKHFLTKRQKSKYTRRKGKRRC